MEVETPSRQTEESLAAGRLARVDKPDDAQLDLPGVDLSGLSAREAISQVKAEKDAQKLKAHLAKEQRRTVIDALEKRLEAIEGGSG